MLLKKNDDFKHNYEMLMSGFKELEIRNSHLEKVTRKQSHFNNYDTR